MGLHHHANFLLIHKFKLDQALSTKEFNSYNAIVHNNKFINSSHSELSLGYQQECPKHFKSKQMLASPSFTDL